MDAPTRHYKPIPDTLLIAAVLGVLALWACDPGGEYEDVPERPVQSGED